MKYDTTRFRGSLWLSEHVDSVCSELILILLKDYIKVKGRMSRILSQLSLNAPQRQLIVEFSGCLEKVQIFVFYSSISLTFCLYI